MNTLALTLLAALSWYDLDDGINLRLTQKIALGEPSFPAGTPLKLISREPLAVPGAPLLLIKLEETNCAHPEWKSEMEIITPAGNEESSAVGVELEEGCQWSIWVEQKDLFTNSFFALKDAT